MPQLGFRLLERLHIFADFRRNCLVLYCLTDNVTSITTAVGVTSRHTRLSTTKSLKRSFGLFTGSKQRRRSGGRNGRGSTCEFKLNISTALAAASLKHGTCRSLPAIRSFTPVRATIVAGKYLAITHQPIELESYPNPRYGKFSSFDFETL